MANNVQLLSYGMAALAAIFASVPSAVAHTNRTVHSLRTRPRDYFVTVLFV